MTSSLDDRELTDLEIENFECKSFVPEARLKEFFTTGKIRVFLEDAPGVKHYLHDEIIQAVSHNGTKVFATLVSIRQVELIVRFLETDQFSKQLDSMFPLLKSTVASVFEGLGDRAERMTDRFYKAQWKFAAPVFRKDFSHRLLDPHTVLPFLNKRKSGGGYFGEVSVVTVEPLHHTFHEHRDFPIEVILKEIKHRRGGNPKAEFDHEKDILSFLRCQRHPNIIELLTAYTINDSFFLLFPKADGDLEGFLSRRERPPGWESDDDFFRAIYELASAISLLHNFNGIAGTSTRRSMIGCHLDLGPRNILYKCGKLILADFGLSRLRDEAEGSQSYYKIGGGNYLAPEAESPTQDFKKNSIGRPSDIWSFGCILLEIAIYLEGGSEGVKDFFKSREVEIERGFTVFSFHAGDKPNKSVTDKVSDLESSASATHARRSLARLIANILVIAPEARPDAKSVTAVLFQLAQKSCFDKTCTVIDSLCANGNLEADVERRRFHIWGDITGLRKNFSNTSWFGEPRSLVQMQDLAATLGSIEAESKALVQIFDGEETVNYNAVYYLRTLIDKLWETQSLPVVRNMTGLLEAQMLQAEDIEKLKNLDSLLDDDHREWYKRIALLATMKEIAAQTTHASTGDGAELVNKSYIRGSEPFGPHTVGILHKEQGGQVSVLVEIMKYDQSWVQSNRVAELVQRIQHIVSQRSLDAVTGAFPVLRCIGHYQSMGHFGIIYELPPPSKPLSLNVAISMLSARKSRPSLDDVFQLAETITRTIFELHISGWVHKSISSLNVLLLPEDLQVGSIASSIRHPRLIGFNYSRPSKKSAFTQGMTESREQMNYQHPTYLRKFNKERFRLEYDYYSIGLVLMEIGVWKCLGTIIRDDNLLAARPENLRKALTAKWATILGTYMGEMYKDAVVACLDGSFETSPEADIPDHEICQAFQTKVLRPLSERIRREY